MHTQRERLAERIGFPSNEPARLNMLPKAWRALAGAAAFAALSVFGTSAQAGNISGDLDSIFGGAYANTSFAGAIYFFVPDACLPAGTPVTRFIADGDACSGGGMYLISASVNLYDYSTPTPTFLNQVVFAPPVQSPDPVQGFYVDWDGTNIVDGALETDLIGPQPSGVDASFAPANLFLRFNFQNTQDPVGAYLIGCNYNVDKTCVPTSDVSNRATVTYRTPEPGTLALLLSALGAGAFLRRRAVFG